MFKKDAEYFAEGSKEFYQRLILGILETNSFMVRHLQGHCEILAIDR